MMGLAGVRAALLGAVVVAAFAGTVTGAAPASAEDVPEEWGDPVFEAAFLTVVGRQDGHLPGRRGNQHVTVATTRDEEVLIGQVSDWWCPAGVTAPVYFGEATSCRSKGSFHLGYESGPDAVASTAWAPNLRYMSLRASGRIEDAAGATVERGIVSVRVRAGGALEMDVWDDFGDTSSWQTRGDARVVGGRFLGTRWLDMTSVEVVDHEVAVYSYYDVPAT